MAVFSIQVCSLSFFDGRREYTGPAPAWFYGINPRSSYRKSVLPLLQWCSQPCFCCLKCTDSTEEGNHWLCRQHQAPL